MSASPFVESRVFMNLEPGERVEFAGTGVCIELIGKSGRQARLQVSMPRQVSIRRTSPEAPECAGPRTQHAMIGSTERG